MDNSLLSGFGKAHYDATQIEKSNITGSQKLYTIQIAKTSVKQVGGNKDSITTITPVSDLKVVPNAKLKVLLAQNKDFTKLAITQDGKYLLVNQFVEKPVAGKLVKVENIQVWDLYPPHPVIKIGSLGINYEVNTLFKFFMIFVLTAGVAALILFILSSKLKKLMEN